MKKISMSLLFAVTILALSGCGEKSNVLVPGKITDQNWSNGISVNKVTNSQFSFYYDASSSSPVLAVGDKLVFAKSGERKVVAVTPAGNYVNVLVEGPALDAAGDGYPNPVKVAGAH